MPYVLYMALPLYQIVLSRTYRPGSDPPSHPGPTNSPRNHPHRPHPLHSISPRPLHSIYPREQRAHHDRPHRPPNAHGKLHKPVTPTECTRGGRMPFNKKHTQAVWDSPNLGEGEESEEAYPDECGR